MACVKYNYVVHLIVTYSTWITAGKLCITQLLAASNHWTSSLVGLLTNFYFDFVKAFDSVFPKVDCL